MDDSEKTAALVDCFGALTPDLVTEFLSMLRSYGLSDQELFYKWESYCIRMGSEHTKLNLETVLAFKKDVQEKLEKITRAKLRQQQQNSAASRVVQKTPRRQKNSEDNLALLDGLVTNSSVKRKLERSYNTPSSKATRLFDTASPSGALGSSPIRKPLAALSLESTDVVATPFSTRANAGTTIETLNPHISAPTLPLGTSWESRVQLTLNMDGKKFSYRPMHQKLTEAGEVQDDRIDEFMAVVQEHYQFADEEFGNPSTVSPSEVVVVGRIASDSLDGKLNTASVVLESSRRMGAGSRVPLKLDAMRSFSFFPGQIIAVRGVNASGNYFAVSEILEIPPLPTTATRTSQLAAVATRLSEGPLTVMVASGPYTTDDNLHFEALDEICRRAAETCPDVVILTGPFIDSSHPLIQTGDFDIEGVDNREGGTLDDLFREKISRKIQRIDKSLVVMVPSVRDSVSRHISFPQESLKRRGLELPSNIKCLPNPAIFSLNETVFAISTPDILFHISRDELRLNPSEPNPLARLSKALITQRNFYPLFPPPSTASLPKGSAGPNLDVPYLRLADFVNVTPDVLVLPSMLAPSAKIVDGVVVVNPGSLSKRAGAGAFLNMAILPPVPSGDGGGGGGDGEQVVGHKVYERARVEVVRI